MRRVAALEFCGFLIQFEAQVLSVQRSPRVSVNFLGVLSFPSTFHKHACSFTSAKFSLCV